MEARLSVHSCVVLDNSMQSNTGGQDLEHIVKI